MYEQSFQLTSRPFTSTPYVKHYFPAESIRQSLASARMSVERGSGPVVIFGDSGTGKSLMLAVLEEQFKDQFEVVNLACARLDKREELLQSILFGLNLPYRGMSEGELRLSLMDFLAPSEANPNGMLLLIDEAHTLPVELLDEVRLITNFVRDGQPRVRLAMAGNQGLEFHLNDPKLDSFNQRIAARCYLTTLSQQETADYVIAHIDRAGGNGSMLFPESTLRKLHELTNGCPRYINLACDHALIRAATQGLNSVDENFLSAAWSDVQNLPLDPVAGSAQEQLSEDDNWTVIEFGSLDDDQGEQQDAEEAYGYGALNDTVLSEQSDLVESADSYLGHQVSQNCPDVEHELYDANGLGEIDANSEYSATADHQTDDSVESIADGEVVEFENPTISATTELSTEVPAHSLDPFGEQFDTEESVYDRYAPLVVAQNQASTTLTAEDVSYIVPHEIIHSNDSAIEAEPEGHVEAERHVEPEGHVEPDVSADCSEEYQAPQYADSPPVDSESDQECKDPDAKDSDEILRNDEIERRAEEILQSISLLNEPDLSVQPEPSIGSTEPEPEHDDPSIVAFENQADQSAVAFEDAFAEPADSHDELDVTQKILQELIEQKNRQAIHQTPVQSEVANVVEEKAMEIDSTDYENTHSAIKQETGQGTDDRDMIFVSRVEEETVAPRQQADPLPFANTAVSTGRAKRVEYQDLFEQLRNISDD